jgi:hypothetical protein
VQPGMGRELMSDSSANRYAIQVGFCAAADYAQHTLSRFVYKEVDSGHFPWKLAPRRTRDAFVSKTNLPREGVS